MAPDGRVKGGNTMARSKAEAGMIDRFRYAPGDGHAYVWHQGEPVVTVYRIVIRNEGNGVDLEPTGDVISLDPAWDADGRVTASGMARVVDGWRAAP